MALYKETSYDDWARRQRQSLANSAQNLQQKQAGLEAAQNAKQKTTLESALSGLVGGLKERGSDILNTAKNIGKTVVGSINQIGANKAIENAQKDDSKRRNEIAKKYGFNSYSEAANSGNASQEFWNEIKDNNKQTKEKQEQNNARQGSFGDVTKVNTNEAKGQALNTIDSVLDLLPGGLGAAANIAGGGISGIGDEYKAAGRENRDIDWTNARNNALVGAASGIAGMAGGNALGSAATKLGGNALGKLAGSQLAKGIAGGAASGAVGGGLGTYLNGGSLEDALLAAKEGAKAGAIGGGVMAGTMGLGGTALNKLRNRGGNIKTPGVEPMEATTVQKNRIDQPTAQRIEAEAPSTRRGIAITDLDAGEQAINVRNGRPTESRGKYIDSVVRRSDANLPEAQKPTYDQRFSKLENIGDNNLLDALNNRKSVYGQEYAYENLIEDMTPALRERVKEAVREGAEYNNPYREFEQYDIYSQSDLPKLNRQEYYEDTYGKLKNKGGIMSAEDIPSYMQPHLSDQIPRGNDVILSELFKLGSGAEQKQDLTDSYELYKRIAQTRAPKKTYSQENLATGLALDDQLRADITKQLVDTYAPTRKISIEKALGQTQDVPVENLATNYQRSTIPARQYDQQTVKNIPEAETATNRALTNAPEQRIATQEPELDYNTQIQRQKAQIQADKLKRQAIGGVMEQYGTTRLSDRIEGLPNAIEDMLKLGFTERAEIDNYAKQMTGKDSEIAKAIRKSLNDAGATDTNLGITMEDVFASSGAEEAAQKKIKSFFDAHQKKYATDNGTIKRSDLYDLGKELEKEGYKKYDRGVRNQNTTDQAYGEALITLSEAAIGKATDGVDVSKNIDLNKLIAIAPDNAEHIARMENLAQNAKTVQDLRSAMANATKLNLLKQAEEYNRNTYGQNQGDFGKNANNAIKGIKAANSRNPVIALTQAGIEMASESPKIKQKAIKKAYEKAQKFQSQANGETPIQTGKLAGIKEKIANIKDAGIVQGAKNIANGAAERIGNATANLNNETLSNIGLNDGLTLGTYMTNQANRQIGAEQARDAVERMNNAQAVQAAQADYDNALADYQAQEATYNNQMAQLQSQTGNTATLNRIAQAMDLAMAAGDINAYSQLADLYKQAYNIYEMQNPTTKNEGKALSANQSKALAASQQLEQLAQMTPNAGTVASNIPLLGNLVDLTGGNEYANQAEALATTLGYLLSGANIKESEAKRIGQSYVPTAFDSENVRQQKLDRARQLIQSYMSDTGAIQQ